MPSPGSRTVTPEQFRKLLRKKSRSPAREEAPRSETEQYPDVCHWCGEKATVAGGCVEVTDAHGSRRMHRFGCGE